MSNELVISQTGLVKAIETKGIDNLIKPLVREIYLFDTYVAGTSFIEDESLFDNLKEGDKLTLQREDNKFDKKAILILNENRVKLGYVPEKDNVVFSRLMDAGKMLSAKVIRRTKKGSFNQIDIAIYLVDF